MENVKVNQESYDVIINRLNRLLQVVKECIKKLDDKILKNKGGSIDDK